MARIANKKKVDNNAGLLKTIDGIDKKKVKDIADFGRFIVVILTDGAVFHTHVGFEIRCKAWAVTMDGKATETSLYTWLCNLVDMKKETKGKEEELFPGADVTYLDMLDSMSIITEANLCHPITAFIDIDKSVSFANEHLDWLVSQTKQLESAMQSEVKEETEDDIKKNFEHGQQAIMAEQLAKIQEAQKTKNK